jgi:hypothetical protein
LQLGYIISTRHGGHATTDFTSLQYGESNFVEDTTSRRSDEKILAKKIICQKIQSPRSFFMFREGQQTSTVGNSHATPESCKLFSISGLLPWLLLWWLYYVHVDGDVMSIDVIVIVAVVVCCC